MGCDSSLPVAPGLEVENKKREPPPIKWKRLPTTDEARDEYVKEGTLHLDSPPGHLELRAILDIPQWQRVLGTHVKELNMLGDLMCWIDMMEYKTISTDNYRRSKASHICNKYLEKSGVLFLVHVTPAELVFIHEAVLESKRDGGECMPKDIFDVIRNRCFVKIYDNFFGNFKESEEYDTIKRMIRRSYNSVEMDDFEYIKKLGSGTYGIVVECKKKTTGVHFAMKIQSKMALLENFADNPKRVEGEKMAAIACSHPFIVQLEYAIQTDTLALMVLELGNGSDLNEALKQTPFRRFDEDRLQFYAGEIVLALSHMHEMGLIYRDLKPGNILLNSDGHIKLVDLGAVSDSSTDEHKVSNGPSIPFFEDQQSKCRADASGLSTASILRHASGSSASRRYVYAAPTNEGSVVHRLDSFSSSKQESDTNDDHNAKLFSDKEIVSDKTAMSAGPSDERHSGFKIATDVTSSKAPPTSPNTSKKNVPLASTSMSELPSNHALNGFFLHSNIQSLSCRESQKVPFFSRSSSTSRKPKGNSFKMFGGASSADSEDVDDSLRNKRAKSIIGTFGYMAPEMVIILAQHPHEVVGYTYTVDWWSFGVTLFKLLMGCRPFNEHSMTRLIREAPQHQGTFEFSQKYSILFQELVFEEHASLDSCDFIKHLLDVNPETRLGSGRNGIRNIKQHPFFSGLDFDLLEEKLVMPPFLPEKVRGGFADQTYPSFNAMMKDVGVENWLTDQPNPGYEKYFDNWNYTSPSTLKMEIGLAEEMQRFSDSLKVSFSSKKYSRDNSVNKFLLDNFNTARRKSADLKNGNVPVTGGQRRFTLLSTIQSGVGLSRMFSSSALNTSSKGGAPFVPAASRMFSLRSLDIGSSKGASAKEKGNGDKEDLYVSS